MPRYARDTQPIFSLFPSTPSNRFLELLGCAEGDFLAGLDLDFLAGCRVAALAGSALANDQDAETADADAVTLLEVLGHQADHVAKDRFSLLFRQFVGFRETCGDVFQGNCRYC